MSIKEALPLLRFLLGLALAMGLWFGAAALAHLPMFRLQKVEVAGAQHVSQEQAQLVTKQFVHGNLFDVNLAEVRAGFSKLPWVRSVDVRRKWPNELDVTLREHKPLARWNDGALVDVQGDVFMAASDARLPHLGGPAGSSVAVMQAWQNMRQILAPIGRQPVDVVLSERGSWNVTLDNGLQIALGRDDQAMTRLARWVGLYPAMMAQLNSSLISVDLRYPQGFAVRLAPAANNNNGTHTQGKVS